MIAISNSYPSRNFLLRIAEFAVARHERVAVIGLSGTGKTTMLNLIAGISVPRRESVWVNGTSIDQLNDEQSRQFRMTQIAFIFQEFELSDEVTKNVLQSVTVKDKSPIA